MNSEFYRLREQIETIRSNSLGDIRSWLKAICYIQCTLVLSCIFLPNIFASSKLLDIADSIAVLRHESDLNYLKQHAAADFYIFYKSAYAFQLLSTLLLLFMYCILCILSRKKKYFTGFKDTYLLASTAYVIGLSFSLIFLMTVSEFGVFQAEHSWFEDNKNQDLDLFPIPLGRFSLFFTAMLFVFSFLVSVALLENLIMGLLGEREELTMSDTLPPSA